MNHPTEEGYYWYQEPGEEVKMCKVYMHRVGHLRITFIDEGNMSFKLNVIEEGTQFKKIEEHKF